MAKPDKTIDPRILESAKQEFLKTGFENASLQTICKQAQVTTGALYRRYKNKEALFCAVVEETVQAIQEMLMEHLQDLDEISDEELIRAWEMQEDTLQEYFAFFEQHREGFVLLLSGSAGTRYANYAHELVAQMSEHTIRYYREGYERGLFQAKISDEEFHVLLSAFWTTIYEPFIHNMSREQIEDHARLICRFFNWKGVIGVL